MTPKQVLLFIVKFINILMNYVGRMQNVVNFIIYFLKLVTLCLKEVHLASKRSSQQEVSLLYYNKNFLFTET